MNRLAALLTGMLTYNSIECPVRYELVSWYGDTIQDIAQRLSDLTGDTIQVMDVEDQNSDRLGGQCSREIAPGTVFRYVLDCYRS